MNRRQAKNIVEALDSRPNLTWTKAELQAAAKAKDLPTYGTKNQILERLNLHELGGGGAAKRPEVVRTRRSRISARKSKVAYRRGGVTLTEAQMRAAREIIAQELEEHRKSGLVRSSRKI